MIKYKVIQRRLPWILLTGGLTIKSNISIFFLSSLITVYPSMYKHSHVDSTSSEKTRTINITRQTHKTQRHVSQQHWRVQEQVMTGLTSRT